MRTLGFAAIVLLIGCAHTPAVTAPARSACTSEQVALPDGRCVLRVEGLTFEGTDSDGGKYVFRFDPGGRLHYTSETGTYDEDSWKQEGDRVEMNFTNGFAIREARVEGDRLVGSGHNVRNESWTFVYERKQP